MSTAGPKLTAEQKRQLRQDARDHRAILSLESFSRQAWKLVNPGRKLQWNWHHRLICKDAQEFTRPLWDPEAGEPEPGQNEWVVCEPPRSLKSFLMAICLPAWLWVHAPHLGIQGISNAEKLATKHSVKSQELIKSEWYQRILRHKNLLDTDGKEATPAWGISKRTANKANFENDKGGDRSAFGVDGSIIGEGADLQLIDDPLDAKAATRGTPQAVAKRMEQVVSDYDDVWASRLNDPTKSLRLVIMQPLDPGDLSQTLIRRGARRVVLPLEFDPDFPDDMGGVHPLDPRTEPGELLMAKRWPAWWVAQAKERAARSFSAQYNMRPRRKSGGLFKKSHFANRYTEDPQFVRVDEIVLFVDCKFSDQVTASWVVVQAWGRRSRGWFALLHQVRAHLGFVGTVGAILGVLELFPSARKVVVENKALGPAVVQLMRADVPGMTEWNPGTRNKWERAEAGSIPPMEAGQVWYPSDERATWMPGFVERHLAFDGKSGLDDEIDTESMGLLNMTGGGRGNALERLKAKLPAGIARGGRGRPGGRR